jgi:hypothetical protein
MSLQSQRELGPCPFLLVLANLHTPVYLAASFTPRRRRLEFYVPPMGHHVVALNEGLRCKKALWRPAGRSELESLVLAPSADDAKTCSTSSTNLPRRSTN